MTPRFIIIVAIAFLGQKASADWTSDAIWSDGLVERSRYQRRCHLERGVFGYDPGTAGLRQRFRWPQ